MIFSKISNIRPFSLALVSLLKSGFTPTATQFNQFLFFLSKSKRFKLIIHLVKSNQFKGDSKTRRIFIEALVKEDKYDEAVQCLKEKNTQMEKRLFDSLIQPLCKRNPEKALSILQDCSVEKELEALHQEEQILASKGTQGCGLVVNEVVENLELSDSKLNGDKKHYVILPISPGLGGQSYLILVAGERFEVSRGISQGVRKLSRTPWS